MRIQYMRLESILIVKYVGLSLKQMIKPEQTPSLRMTMYTCLLVKVADIEHILAKYK